MLIAPCFMLDGVQQETRKTTAEAVILPSDGASLGLELHHMMEVLAGSSRVVVMVAAIIYLSVSPIEIPGYGLNKISLLFSLNILSKVELQES